MDANIIFEHYLAINIISFCSFENKLIIRISFYLTIFKENILKLKWVVEVFLMNWKQIEWNEMNVVTVQMKPQMFHQETAINLFMFRSSKLSPTNAWTENWDLHADAYHRYGV